MGNGSSAGRIFLPEPAQFIQFHQARVEEKVPENRKLEVSASMNVYIIQKVILSKKQVWIMNSQRNSDDYSHYIQNVTTIASSFSFLYSS